MKTYTFATTQLRDAFIDREYPRRKALDCPGSYKVQGGTLHVFCETVTFYGKVTI